MTKKQIRKVYEEMNYLEKIERLEFWAVHYLAWLDIEDDTMEALMEDVVLHYESTLEQEVNQ
jgi:hypothetical protein